MAEKIPRRLKRFHRKKNIKEKKLSENLKSLSKKKQKDFNEKLKIQKEKPEKIAETIFEQMKRKEQEKKQKKQEKKNKKKKKAEEISKKIAGKKEGKEEIPLWKKRRMERLKERKEIKEEPKKTETEKKENKKEETKKETERKRKEKTEEKNEIEFPEMKGTNIKDLLGETKPAKTGKLKKKEIEGFKLDLDLSEEKKGIQKKTIESQKETEKKEKGKCINCGQQFNELIFCSKCGNAYCDKCTKIKHKEGNKTKYLCPHCGHVTKK